LTILNVKAPYELGSFDQQGFDKLTQSQASIIEFSLHKHYKLVAHNNAVKVDNDSGEMLRFVKKLSIIRSVWAPFVQK